MIHQIRVPRMIPTKVLRPMYVTMEQLLTRPQMDMVFRGWRAIEHKDWQETMKRLDALHAEARAVVRSKDDGSARDAHTRSVLYRRQGSNSR